MHCNAVLLNISSKYETSSMSTILQMRKIDEDEGKETIMKALADRYSRTILETTMDSPKSVLELSAMTKIPISTVYRRIQELHDKKLLSISGSISDDGKKFFLYKSKLRGVTTSFDNGVLTVSILPNKVSQV